MSWLNRLFHRTSSNSPQSDAPSSPFPLQQGDLLTTDDNEPGPIEIGTALSELFTPGMTWNQRRQVLEKRQHVLLTEDTITALVQMALDARRSNPVQASFYLANAELLDNARRVGISTAWQTHLNRVADGHDVPPTDRLLLDTLGEWLLLVNDPRTQCRFLEDHLELLSYGSLALFLLKIVQAQKTYGPMLNATQYNDFHMLWDILFDARRRGGDIQAVRDAYANRYSGFVLDVPE